MPNRSPKLKTGSLLARVVAAALVAVALVFFGSRCSDQRLADLLAQAESAARAGDARAAAVYYGTAASQSPNNDLVRWQLAKVLLTVRDGASAEKHIRAAAELGVDDERTRPALAQALYLQGKLREVTALPVDGLGKTAAGIILAYQSRAFIGLGQIEAAESLFNRAAKLSRYSADVFFAQAELALARGDHQLALEALHNVDLLETDFPYAAAKYGEIAMAGGDAAEAERYYSEAVEQRFGSWRDLLNRGRARLLQGKVGPALQDVGELLTAAPQHSDVQLLAYQAYALHGDQGRARMALEHALELDSDNFLARYALARIEVAAGNRSRGESLARSAHALQPLFVPARKLLAVLLLEQGRADEAVEMILPAAEASPDNDELQRILAYSLLKRRQYDGLIEIAGRLQGQMSDDRRVELEQGVERLKAGDVDAASGILTRALAFGTQDLRAVNPLEINPIPRPDRLSANQAADGSDSVAPAQVHLQSAQGARVHSTLPSVPAEDTAVSATLAVDHRLQDGEQGVTGAAPSTVRHTPAQQQAEQRGADFAQSTRRELQRVPLATVDNQRDSAPAQVVERQRQSAQPPESMPMRAAPAEPDAANAPELRDSPNAMPSIVTAGATGVAGPPAAEPISALAPPPEGTAAVTAIPAATVEAFVRDWAADWSRQDVDGYLSRYAADFQPPDGASRAAWAEDRRLRLTQPQVISVQVSAFEIVPLDGQHVAVSFEQAYRANHYRDRVRKTLDLVFEGGGWKILKELSR